MGKITQPEKTTQAVLSSFSVYSTKAFKLNGKQVVLRRYNIRLYHCTPIVTLLKSHKAYVVYIPTALALWYT